MKSNIGRNETNWLTLVSVVLEKAHPWSKMSHEAIHEIIEDILGKDRAAYSNFKKIGKLTLKECSWMNGIDIGKMLLQVDIRGTASTREAHAKQAQKKLLEAALAAAAKNALAKVGKKQKESLLFFNNNIYD